MMKSFAVLAFLALMMTVSCGSDWLEGGSVGPGNYGEIRQYFTDPIFYTRIPVPAPASFYQPNGVGLLREPLYLGKYAIRYSQAYPSNISIYPAYPWQSEFRNSSLTTMEEGSVQANWTGALIFARTKSSLKVLQNGVWTSI
jgi:hypothetical protein